MPSRDVALRAVVQAWHDKAAGDLHAARACILSPAVPGWVIGFHLQQAVEKALKGLLVAAGCEPPRTHDLVRLDDLLRDSGGVRPLPLEQIEALVSFAVDDRYPVLLAPDVGRSEVEELVSTAEAAVQALANAVAQLGPKESPRDSSCGN